MRSCQWDNLAWVVNRNCSLNDREKLELVFSSSANEQPAPNNGRSRLQALCSYRAELLESISTCGRVQATTMRMTVVSRSPGFAFEDARLPHTLSVLVSLLLFSIQCTSARSYLLASDGHN